MAPNPEIPKVDVVKEATRLQSKDGIFPNRVDEQFANRFVDPITGLNSFNADRSLPTADGVRDAAKLRIAESAFIRASGFDNRIDPETNQPLNLKTQEGFQRWYELSRKFVTEESAKMKATLQAEGKFIPESDPVTKLPFEDDSLKLHWVLRNQVGGNYVSQEDYQNWQANFQQLVDQYGSVMDMGNIVTYSENNFYQMSLRTLLSNTLVAERREVINGMNTLLAKNRLSIPERQGKTSLTVPEMLQRIPDLIGQSITAYEAKGVYIPDKNPDDPEVGDYPSPLAKLTLAIEIAEGRRPDILQKRQEELEKQARVVEQRRVEAEERKKEQRVQIAQRRATEASIREVSSESDPKIGFGRRFYEKVRDLSKVDALVDLYKRVEHIPARLVAAGYHALKGDFSEHLDREYEKQTKIIEGFGLNPDVMFDRWRKGSMTLDSVTSAGILAPIVFTQGLLSGDFAYEVENRNLRTMQTLERKRPGITKVLYEKYGVANYTRYPVDMLVDQYDKRNEHDRNYGVVINSVDDWNGGFLHNQGELKTLFTKSKKNSMDTIIVEAENKIDLARALLSLRKSHTKGFSYAVIAGHGMETTIDFGGRGELNRLHKKDLLGSGTEAAGGFFENGASIILASCSVGAEGGIAQELSRQTGLIVMGSEKPATGAFYKFKKKPDGLRYLDVNFRGMIRFTSTRKRIYQNGQLVDKVAA